MGIYLNPGNDGFRRAVRSEIYVDKTGLIALTNKYLDTEQQFICVSRPRRFGNRWRSGCWPLTIAVAVTPGNCLAD